MTSALSGLNLLGYQDEITGRGIDDVDSASVKDDWVGLRHAPRWVHEALSKVRGFRPLLAPEPAEVW